MQAGNRGASVSSSRQGSSRAKQGQHEQAVPFPVLLSRTAYQMLVEQVWLIARQTVNSNTVHG